MEFDDHFFRRESGRLVAALIKIFGVHNVDLAEDVTQDAFIRALEVWKLRGVPPNPSAWLMTTAKNRALDVLRRERTARTFAPELGRLLESEWTLVPILNELFEPRAIKDDQLRVMFSCCDRRLREEAQVALILNIICGFSVDEVAAAFFNSHAAVEKRIIRAKRTLASSGRLFDVTHKADFDARLPTVHRALYLLFNEGYHGTAGEAAVRSELCHEAIRLAKLIIAHPYGAGPVSFALAALTCLHTARLPARVNPGGGLTSLTDQDRGLWNQGLIIEGARLLEQSASGKELSKYHIEAMIALIHAQAQKLEDTNWQAIVEQYDLLLTLKPSPVVALNRAIAMAQAVGPESGLQELNAIPHKEKLLKYPFYFAAMGAFEMQLNNREQASKHYTAAMEVARNSAEREFYRLRLEHCQSSLGAGDGVPFEVLGS